MVVICINDTGFKSLMLHTKFHQNRPIGSWKEVFKVFYHILTWQPSWSCDQHYADKFSSTSTYKLTFKICEKCFIPIKVQSIMHMTDEF